MPLSQIKDLFGNKTQNRVNSNSSDAYCHHLGIESLSELEGYDFPTLSWSYLIYFMAIVGVVIVLLNFYIIALFLRFRTLRIKRNIFPINLTISDAFVGAFVIPVFAAAEELLRSVGPTSYLSAHRLHHQSGVLLIFNSLVSLFSLSAVIVDRAVAICFPLRYRRDFTARKATVVVLLIWGFSAIFACLSFAFHKPLYDADNVSDVFDLLVVMTKLVNNLTKYDHYKDVFFSFCIVGTLISGFSLLVQTCIICRMQRRNRQQSSISRRHGNSEDLKAAYMLSLMFIAVFLWLFSVVYLHKSKRSWQLYVGMYLGRFCLSIFNPILYTLLKQDVKLKVNEDFRMIKNVFYGRAWLKCAKRKVSQNATVNFTKRSPDHLSNDEHDRCVNINV